MKNLRIGQVSDSHLREAQYGNIRRGPDFCAGLRSAITTAAKQVDVFVHTGDIFDMARPSARVVDQLMEIDVLLRQLKKKMICITGNHDWNSHPWLKTLFKNVGDYGIQPLDDDATVFEGVKFVGIPPHNAVRFAELTTEISNKIRGADVVLYHGFVTGIVPAYVGDKHVTDISQIPRHPETKAILLGDIHIQGYINLSDTCIAGYSGSTEVCSASEKPEKSVPVILVTDAKAEVVDYIPFKTRKFLHAKLYEEEDVTAFIAEIKKFVKEAPVIHFEFAPELQSTIARVYAAADINCIVRCEKMPRTKASKSEYKHVDDDGDLGIDDFFKTTLGDEEDTDILALALDVIAQPTEAVGLVNEFVDKSKIAYSNQLRDIQPTQ